MFNKQTLLSLIAGFSLTAAQTNSQQFYTPAEVAAAQASVQPVSPVSNVQGLAFDRFVDIWLENTVRRLASSFIGVF